MILGPQLFPRHVGCHRVGGDSKHLLEGSSAKTKIPIFLTKKWVAQSAKSDMGMAPD